MISGARETVAEIEAPLPRKRALCRIHHVLLKRLILKFGDGGDGFTPDNVRGSFGRRGIKIYRGTSGTKRKLYPKKGGGEKPWKRSVSILGIPKLLE
jgi:hypothetical protein